MKSTRSTGRDARMVTALAGIQAVISEHYPDATFEISEGDDPRGLYLLVTVDVEDTDDVAALYSEQLLDLQVEQRLSVYVLPVRPIERVFRELRDRQAIPPAKVG